MEFPVVNTEIDRRRQQDGETRTSDLNASLLRAFEVLQQQARQLEEAHQRLERRLAEAHLELAQRNAELAAILASMEEAVFLLNADNAIKEQNRAGEELQKLFPTFWEHEHIRNILAQKGNIKDQELTLSLPDGREKIFIVNLSRVTGEEGSRLLVCRDVTDYRALRLRVEREDRLRSLGQVAANVAHEIRNPLQAIEGFLILLRRDLEGETGPIGQIERILEATRRLNSVVSNLLGFARDLRITPQRLAVQGLMQDVLAQIQMRANAMQVHVELECGPPHSACAIDGILMRQVLLNLVHNAIEACSGHANARITLSWEETDTEVILRVRDNGPGMNKITQQRIFEPFFTSKSGGIGLGLALCRRIVDAHAGQLTVDSREGEGACFSICLKKEDAP
ncbi:MAG: GHKL domain-containing protein [Lentisphaerae bacterium]|nr:MAG: GHKL domain-containing protein [Lentisphaerota bacterium]